MAMNPAAAAGPNPWLPFDGSPNDCSTGICSIYCPQWCYFIFPPPPPSPENSDPRTAISPLVIALIAALATVFLLLAYYTVISKYCRRRRRRRRRTGLGGGGDDPNADPAEEDGDGDRWRTGGGGSRGLDEAAIKSITVFAYKRGDGLVDGSDCSVCLSEFKEEESLRLLPKCNHAFHVGCIDMWLKSHSNCPLCRSNIAILSSNPNPNPPPPVAQGPQNSPESHASSLRIQRREEALVMVVEDSVRVSREEILVMSFPKTVVESPPPPPPIRRDEENRETRSPRDVIEITVPEEERFDSSVNRPSIRSIAAELGGGGEDDLRIANCRSSSITATGPSTQIEEERDPKSNDRSTIEITAQEEPRFDSSLQHRDEGDGKDWRTGNCRSSSMSGAGSSTQTEQEVDGKSNNRSTGEDLEAARSHGSAEPHKGKNLIIIPN